MTALQQHKEIWTVQPCPRRVFHQPVVTISSIPRWWQPGVKSNDQCGRGYYSVSAAPISLNNICCDGVHSLAGAAKSLRPWLGPVGPSSPVNGQLYSLLSEEEEKLLPDGCLARWPK
ncbi:hypothetical protein FJTKL_08016 [Diaporthe vaccinii]|uniref:Uncharacterized protein n=1 Tax=Diaporthe vaccinii TaxID=105482 RepID=A0ABR4FE78_9PEZI